MGLYGAAHGWWGGGAEGGGAKRLPLPKMSYTYLAMMKLGTVIPYLKKIQKIYYMREAAVEFYGHQQFFTGNWQILLYQEIQILIAFRYIISNSFDIF